MRDKLSALHETNCTHAQCHYLALAVQCAAERKVVNQCDNKPFDGDYDRQIMQGLHRVRAQLACSASRRQGRTLRVPARVQQ